jgi:murein DD-endopeptidase MepM/ murein hydrolase activator NlpD
MTRLGASILLLIVLAAAGFASMLSFGAGPSPGTVRVEPVEAGVGDERPARGACFDVAQHERCGGGEREEPVHASSTTLTVPVAGYPRRALADSWGDAREGGARGHEGIDIIAPAGTPVLAAAPGRVEKLFDSARGGTTLYQRSADGRWLYYYAHLAAYAPDIREGARVRAGQPIARVGDTGDAGAGNYHLHFGVERMRRGARWWQGEAVNPYPLLARAPATR